MKGYFKFEFLLCCNIIKYKDMEILDEQPGLRAQNNQLISKSQTFDLGQ